MVEHLVCNQAVVGSNPVASTTAQPLAIGNEQSGASRRSLETR